MTESAQSRFGAGIVQPRHHREQAGALHQRTDGRAVIRPLDEIALRVGGEKGVSWGWCLQLVIDRFPLQILIYPTSSICNSSRRGHHHPGSLGGVMQVLDLSHQEKKPPPDPVRVEFR
jgi:hypothetical protein